MSIASAGRFLIVIFYFSILFVIDVFSKEYPSPHSFKEVESKINFRIVDDKAMIMNKIQNALEKLEGTDLQFFKMNDSSFTVVKKPTEEVFYDIYLDTKESSLLSSLYSYRVRYRFESLNAFYYHSFLPFLRKYYPSRCEIQLKGPYRKKKNNFITEVMEYRTEFRHTNYPKDKPPPWPRKKIISLAKDIKSAVYENKIINQPISPVLEVITKRTRWHVKIDKENPWGRGFNPNHVFIISFDESYIKGHSKPVRYELEIQIDRNTYFLVLNQKEYSEDKFVKILAEQTEFALYEDIKKIEELILEELNDHQTFIGNSKYFDLMSIHN